MTLPLLLSVFLSINNITSLTCRTIVKDYVTEEPRPVYQCVNPNKISYLVIRIKQMIIHYNNLSKMKKKILYDVLKTPFLIKTFRSFRHYFENGPPVFPALFLSLSVVLGSSPSCVKREEVTWHFGKMAGDHGGVVSQRLKN